MTRLARACEACQICQLQLLVIMSGEFFRWLTLCCVSANLVGHLWLLIHICSRDCLFPVRIMNFELVVMLSTLIFELSWISLVNKKMIFIMHTRQSCACYRSIFSFSIFQRSSVLILTACSIPLHYGFRGKFS